MPKAKKNVEKNENDISPRRAKIIQLYGDGKKDAQEHYARFDKSFKETHEKFIDIEKKCRDFVFGKQWKEEDLQKMKDTKRPALTINLTLSNLLSVYGEYSDTLAEPTVKARGRGKYFDVTLMAKLISGILNDTDYFSTEADVFLDSAISGRGFFNMRIDTDRDPLGEISIFADDNLQVVLSSDMKDYDPDTWPEVFTFEYLTYSEVEAKYGADIADAINYSVETSIGEYESEEQARFGHRLAKPKDRYRNVHDGVVYDEARVITREYRAPRPTWVFVDPMTTEVEYIAVDDLDKADAKKLAKDEELILHEMNVEAVRQAIFAGDVLISDEWSPYEHFMTFPFFYYFLKGQTMGMVENLLSPQEQVNKADSQELHIINSASNGGWQVEENALVNMTPEQLEANGSKTGLVIVRRRGSAPLDKITPNGVPTGISNFGVKAAGHVQRISGINDGMLGMTGANVSGRTVDTKRRAGQAQLRLPWDNLNRAQRYIVRGIISLVQNFFTEPRVHQYVAESGQSEEVAINQVDAAGRVINDVTLGKYSVTMTSKPKRDVQDDYELEKLIRMREAGVNIPDYEIINRSQLDNREEMVSIMRRQAGLDQTPEEQQKAQLMEQIQIQDLQLELAEKESKVELNKATAAERYAKVRDYQDANTRFMLELQNDQQKDIRGAQLRIGLAQLSSDTSLATSRMSNVNAQDITDKQLNSQREQQVLGIAADVAKDERAAENNSQSEQTASKSEKE